MKKLKRIAAIFLAVAMTFSISACNKSSSSSTNGSSGATKTPVTINFWNGWNGPDGVILKKLVKEYNEKNTDKVTVKMDIMEFSSLTEKLATALASGTNPQLHLGFANGEYAIEGQYIPIDDIFDKTDLKKSDFDPKILADCTYKNHLYGLPFQLTSLYLFWNKDLFKKAGLDPNTPPTTWDQLLEYSKKIDALGGNTIGGGFSFNDSIALGCMMEDNGGNVVASDGTSYKSVLTDPKYINANLAALNTIKKFVSQSKHNTYSVSDNESSFLAGNCGMIVDGSWELAGCKKNGLNYGISLMPGSSKGAFQSAWPVSMCVMKGTTGAKLDACYSFLEYWNNNINNKIEKKSSPAFQWTKNQGYQPYLLSVAKDPLLTSDADYKITSSYINHHKDYYPSSFWNVYSLGTEILTPLAENVAYNKMTPDKALQSADTALKKMIVSMKAMENK